MTDNETDAKGPRGSAGLPWLGLRSLEGILHDWIVWVTAH
jgi:hypothetical protein